MRLWIPSTAYFQPPNNNNAKKRMENDKTLKLEAYLLNMPHLPDRDSIIWDNMVLFS